MKRGIIIEDLDKFLQEDEHFHDFKVDNPFEEIDRVEPHRRYEKKELKKKKGKKAERTRRFSSKEDTKKINTLGTNTIQFAKLSNTDFSSENELKEAKLTAAQKQRARRNRKEKTKKSSKQIFIKYLIRFGLASAALVMLIFCAIVVGSFFRDNPGSEETSVTINAEKTLIVITISGKDIYYNGEKHKLNELQRMLRGFNPANVTVSIIDDNANPVTHASVNKILMELSMLE